MYHRNETTREAEARAHELAAELTDSVYPMLLRYGLKDSWLASQLSLWTLLCAAVTEWKGRWRLTSLMGNSDGLRNFVAADLAERTLVVIQTSGVVRPPRPLRVAVVNAFRGVLREAGRADAVAGSCGASRRPVANSPEKTVGRSESRSMAYVGTLV